MCPGNDHRAKEVAVTFLPAGKHVTCARGEVLLLAARERGVQIPADCGGRGRCRSCAVRIEGDLSANEAPLPSQFSDAEIAAGWRCACQTRIFKPCTVTIPFRAHATVIPVGQDDGPKAVPIESPVLVPAKEKNFWRRGDRIVGPVAGSNARGLAIDLGTTYIAAALMDMVTGEVLATGAIENPQLVFSADVIGRLTMALTNPGLAQEMQLRVVEAIGKLAGELTAGSMESIAEIAVVGNSVMQHLLLGLPLATLARAPYRPYTLDSVDILAGSLGLRVAPGAWLHFGPDIASFIGSDHVAALLDLMVDRPSSPWMLMDIGTNTEISVCHNGTILSASCASGPALEGGMLSSGMRAAAGAIASVRIEGGKLGLTTIGQADPVGICGSGVISLVSELLRSGIVNRRGRLQIEHPFVSEGLSQREILIAQTEKSLLLPVKFTQSDVRAVQLAKAAIRTGATLLLEAAGIAEDEVSRFVIAGAFGRHIDLQAAVAIGLLPPIVSGRVMQVGNAAGAGVRRILACAQARKRAVELALKAQYLELATHPRFHNVFARNADF